MNEDAVNGPPGQNSGAAPARTPEELLARLDALGLKTRTVRHAPVFTVAEAQSVRGDLPGAHCKSLFVKDKKGALFLVVALEDRRLDLKALQAILGAGRLSFASAERLMQYLGVTPGSVTPFALINDPGQAVTAVLDSDMMAAEIVNYHPLTNTMTTALSPADLLAFIRDCGHAPRIVDLGPATARGD